MQKKNISPHFSSIVIPTPAMQMCIKRPTVRDARISRGNQEGIRFREDDRECQQFIELEMT